MSWSSVAHGNLWWLAAGSATFVISLIHWGLGGREIIRPVLEAKGLHPVVRWTTYYAWHLVTITLAGLALMFVWAAVVPGAVLLGEIATVAVVLFAVFSLGLVAAVRQSLTLMPQWGLFLVAGGLGIVGWVGG